MITAQLTAEAIRLHARYLIEVVEELGFCPWARRARLDGHTRQHASMAETPDEALVATTDVITGWTADASIEVAFVLFPRLETSRRAFDALSARITESEAARHPLGKVPFVMAAFHPDAPPDTVTAERLVPYLRRTPDPCLQLIRGSVLESVRENTPQGTRHFDISLLEEMKTFKDETPLRERIARANLDTVNHVGLPELARRLDDIRADRDRTYAALLAR